MRPRQPNNTRNAPKPSSDESQKLQKVIAASGRGDTEQAMGWFADSMRLRDVIAVVSTIEIPLPGTADGEADFPQEGEGPLAA